MNLILFINQQETTMKNYGKNLTWFLGQVAITEPEQFETGEIEIYGEDEQGREGSTDVDLTDLALAAKTRIESLERTLRTISELSEKLSVSVMGYRPDIKVLVDTSLVSAEEMTITRAVMGLREAIQDAEPYGLVRTESGQALTGAIESEHGVVLTEGNN